MNQEALQRFMNDWKSVVFAPVAFWENMEAVGYERPIRFLAVCLAVPWLISAVMGIVLALLQGHSAGLVVAGAVVGLFFTACFIGLNFLSALSMWFVGEKMGSTADTEHCFWVTAFSSAPALLSFVPVFGVIFFLFALVLLFLGIRRIHQLPDVQTVLLLLVVIAVHLLPAMVLGLLAGSAAMGMKSLLGAN